MVSREHPHNTSNRSIPSWLSHLLHHSSCSHSGRCEGSWKEGRRLQQGGPHVKELPFQPAKPHGAGEDSRVDHKTDPLSGQCRPPRMLRGGLPRTHTHTDLQGAGGQPYSPVENQCW